MKKISKSIALLLILVMIASIFTGCLTYYLLGDGNWGSDSVSSTLAVFIIAADIVTLPIQILVGIGILINDGIRNSRGKKIDNIDTFSAVIKKLPEQELVALTQTFDSLQENELASFMQTYNSCPESELAPFTGALNSFSETELAAIASAFNNLSKEEVVSSIEKINSTPQEEFIVMLNNLQHLEFRYQNLRRK